MIESLGMFKQVFKYWYYCYIGFLVISILYINTVLKDTSIKLSSSSQQKVIADIKPAKVTLVVKTLSYNKIYKAKLDNTDTVNDLLDNLWKNQGFYYQKNEYINKIEFENIDKTLIPEGYSWHIFENDKDITNDIYYSMLKDKQEYIITPVKEY
jgi:hypothetical protein